MSARHASSASRGERLALLVLAMLCASGCGNQAPTASPIEPLTEDVPMPTMRVGDVLEYESRAPTMGADGAPSRWVLTVIGVESNGTYHANVTGFDSIGRKPYTRVSELAGPWNYVLPPPYAAPQTLRFPLRQGASWTSVAPNPTINLTQTEHLTVKGKQTLELAGAKVDCVRVEGTSTQTTTISLAYPMRVWYCPSLRAVGRLEADVPSAPVSQTLVAHRLQP